MSNEWDFVEICKKVEYLRWSSNEEARKLSEMVIRSEFYRQEDILQQGREIYEWITNKEKENV